MEPLVSQSLGLIIILHAVIFGGFSAFVAKEKGREAASWGVLGAVFGIVALIAIVGVPRKCDVKAEESQDKSNEKQNKQVDNGWAFNDESHWVCTCGAENEYDHGLKDQICKKCSRGRNVVLGITN